MAELLVGALDDLPNALVSPWGGGSREQQLRDGLPVECFLGTRWGWGRRLLHQGLPVLFREPVWSVKEEQGGPFLESEHRQCVVDALDLLLEFDALMRGGDRLCVGPCDQVADHARVLEIWLAAVLPKLVAKIVPEDRQSERSGMPDVCSQSTVS
ncbi:hypothetical protein D7Y15_06730 [Corallococcus sp. AB030]|nr:hypothetical protein D7Y15_06730 [Corallococcus sp. AB030]